MSDQPANGYHDIEISLHISLKQARAIQKYLEKNAQKLGMGTPIELLLGLNNLDCALIFQVIPQLETLEAVNA